MMNAPKTIYSHFYHQAKHHLNSSKPKIEPKTQLIKSYSLYFEQSYIDKLKKKRERSQSYNTNIINQDTLNSLLCKLKNYYNEVHCINDKKKQKIDQLREDNAFLDFQHKQIIDFQDIDLPAEKVSVKNFNTLKVTKEQLESKVRAFFKEKTQLSEVFKNEIEYAKTIEYMRQQEKDNLKAINDEISMIEKKISAINLFKRNNDLSLIMQQKKQQNYSQIIDQLNDDMDLIDTVMEDQTMKSARLDKTINSKELECSLRKSKIKAAHTMKYEVFNREKEEIQNKIANMNEMIQQKYKKEQRYMKTILCLNFIQKYFLNHNESDRSTLTESKEYKEFLNDKIVIFDENYNPIFEFQTEEVKPEPIKITKTKTNSSQMNKLKPNQSFQNQNEFSSMNSTLNAPSNIMTRSNTPSHLKPFTLRSSFKHPYSLASLNKESSSMMTLSQLKEKFDDIQINRDDLFHYYYRIIDRIRFFRNALIQLNDKQIQYESKKDVYYRKVKEIIMKDYKNFDDLIKHNSRFSEFIKRNEKLIVASKNKYEISKMSQINKGFQNIKSNSLRHKDINKSAAATTTAVDALSSSSVSLTVIGNKNKQIKLTPYSIELFSIDLYKTATRLLRETKNFFEGTHTLIRRTNAALSDKSTEQYKKIERIKCQLFSYKPEPFDQYVIKLLDFISSEDELLSLVNSICGDGTLTKLKGDIFINANANEPNKDYINQVLNKNFQIQNELFAFLNEKRKVLKAYKAAFSFQFSTKSKDDSNSFLLPVSAKRDSKVEYQAKRIYLSKMKHPGKQKQKLIRSQKDTESNYEDSYSDKDTALSDNKTTKKMKKNNSVEQKIIEKLYEPVLIKTLYNRQLNDKMSVIKRLTRSNSKANHALMKKRQEIDEISNSLLVYNNKSKLMIR